MKLSLEFPRPIGHLTPEPPLTPLLREDPRDAGMLLFLGMQGPRKKLTVPMAVTRRTLKTAVTDKLAGRAFHYMGHTGTEQLIGVISGGWGERAIIPPEFTPMCCSIPMCPL